MTEVTIFRIVQEALTNIHRHSGSKTATLRLVHKHSKVFLEIKDDGLGIARDTLASIRTQRSGVGMTGMRERARHLGGDLDVQSDSGGTTIRVTLPVIASQEANAASAGQK
jgi:two-component system NarL family sensor kinase